ncbi:MAG: tRNA preQ1(34) S-adenosylmethionine ribosyltransferase-isomerase QueA, partial [Paracoccaceae bacterium]
NNHAVIDLQYDKSSNIESFLNLTGRMPLPPYILRNRASDSDDDIDYQTIFASVAGSVAAPTASLHFDDKILSDLKDTGIDFSYLTLHVGGGTFLPVKSENIADHLMHSEKGHISQQTAMEINQTKRAGGRIIAVGTTSARLLEAATSNDFCSPFDDETKIFIKPGYCFNLVDGLITNFHLPKSTLIMLVAALIGVEESKKLYSHAIQKKYRFYSYGDSSLLFKKS